MEFKMNVLKINNGNDIPRKYTGITESPFGDKQWFLNGELHRDDGPAFENIYGDKHWFLNGKRHQKDGPAIEFADGSKAWYLNGELHRVDGPAIEYPNGDKSWFLNDINYSQEEWFEKLSEEDKEKAIWNLR
jgi:hypothetical protein